MALSNIAREPRREITESLIGLAILGVLLWADYGFGTWLEGWAGYDRDGGAYVPWGFGMFLGVVGVAVCVVAVILTHALGEIVCDRLQDAGVHLRPRRQPRRRPPPNVPLNTFIQHQNAAHVVETTMWTPLPEERYSAPVKQDKGR